MNNCKDQFAARVGLDWGDKKHVFCVQAAGRKRIEEGSLEQTPEAISDWVAGLRQRFGTGQLAIFLEQSRGALINALMCYENLVLFPINPKSLARFRSALYPSGSKDDPLDARLALEFGSKHQEHLTRWEPDDVPTRRLVMLNQARRTLVDQRTQLGNRLTSTLKAYFPQALKLVGQDLSSPLATDFLKKWPVLPQIQAASTKTVRSFYYGHNSRSEARMKERLELLAQAVPLTTDEAIVQAHSLIAQSLAAQLALKGSAWARCYYDHQLSQGKRKQAGLRALAYKWQRILWRCWQDRTPYDEAKHVQSLLQRAIPIYSSLATPKAASPGAAFIQKDNLR